MPPIPVHIDDPIVPQKAHGVTPQTSATANADRAPATNPAQEQSAAYPSAQPGQAAVPAPTPYIPRPVPEPSRTVPGFEPRQDDPSPPQPGATPVPLSRSSQGVGTLPPPPKAGETLQQPNQTQFMSTLNQMHVPPPQQNYAPTHSTTTSMIPQRNGPTTLNFGAVEGNYDRRRASSEHPSGYQQNIYAQDLSPAQRSSLDQETRKESIAAQFGFGGDSFRAQSTVSGDGNVGEAAGQAWNTAKGWLSTAGQKLAETEESVWKKINGEK